MTGVIFGCLFLIGRRRGLVARDAALLALAAFVVAAVALALRPQLIGMALFAIVLVLVTDRRAHPGRLWAVPFLVLVWANVHGSFFLGPVVLGLAWLEDVHDRVPRPHRALVVAVVSSAAACVTPFGPAVWAYALGLSTNRFVTERITEWQPTSLHDVPGILFFGSAMAVVALIARRGKRTSWPTLAWLGVFFVIGAYAVRGVAWWPLGRGRRDRRRPRHEPGPRSGPSGAAGHAVMRRLNVVVAAIIVLAGVVLLPLWRPTRPGPRDAARRRRDGAARHHRRAPGAGGPGDHVFNPQPWGSWFEFALPDLPVAIDSRIELFPASVWDAYEEVIAGVDGWQAQLESVGRGDRRRRRSRMRTSRAPDGRRLARGLRRRGRLGLRRPELGGRRAVRRLCAVRVPRGTIGAR